MPPAVKRPRPQRREPAAAAAAAPRGRRRDPPPNAHGARAGRGAHERRGAVRPRREHPRPARKVQRRRRAAADRGPRDSLAARGALGGLLRRDQRRPMPQRRRLEQPVRHRRIRRTASTARRARARLARIRLDLHRGGVCAEVGERARRLGHRRRERQQRALLLRRTPQLAQRVRAAPRFARRTVAPRFLASAPRRLELRLRAPHADPPLGPRHSRLRLLARAAPRRQRRAHRGQRRLLRHERRAACALRRVRLGHARLHVLGC